MSNGDTVRDFSDLDALVAEWGLPTWYERLLKRAHTPMEELRAFHAAMVPRLEEIIQFLNQWPLEQIPDEYMPLSYAALAVCEADGAVETWKQPLLVPAAAPSSFIPKGSYYDVGVPDPKRPATRSQSESCSRRRSGRAL
jgi:hypothetical protein